MSAINVVPARRRDELRDLARRSREAILLAAIVGAVTGAGVALGEWIVVGQMLEGVASLPWWAQAWLPLGGLAVAAIVLRVGGRLSSGSADEYIVAFHGSGDVASRPVPYRLLATAASVGAGAPGGLEGGSVYLGAAVGSMFRRRFGALLRSTDLHSLMVAGAAAGVAAIFKAPATGAVFAMEVPYRDDLGRHLLLPALVGSASGYLVFVAVHGTTPLLAVSGDAPFDMKDLLGAALLGVGVGIVVRAWARAIRAAKSFHEHRPAWAGPLVGGSVIGALAMLSHAVLGGNLALTPGYNALDWAADPRLGLGAIGLLIAVRMAGTVGTLAGGGVVGLFLPLVVVGGLLGRLVGGALDVPNLTLFVIVGVAAGLGAGYRVPLAAVMFIAEATGRPGWIVPGLLAAVGADLMMGDSSVTPYQRSN